MKKQPRSVSEETAGEAVTEETEEVTEEVTEEAAEETTEALESEEENKAEVVEEYTLLTVGQTLHQTTADSVLYAFEPEESGWYRIQAFCASGDEPWMNVEKTIYYTWDEEEQIKVEHEYGLSNSWAKGGSDVNRMVWLNQEERYFINAGAEKYANDHAIDIAVCITKADITGLETVQTPAEDSFGCLWLKRNADTGEFVRRNAFYHRTGVSYALRFTGAYIF